jgi:hypothetical protein
MRVSILTGIKEVIYEMTDKQASLVVRKEPIPNGNLAKKELSSERIEFLRLFVNLLLNTTFITEKTKLYVSEKHSSYVSLAEKLQKEQGLEINPSTLQSTVWLDKNKIERYFTSKVLLDVIEYTNTDISRYIATAKELINKYGQSSLLTKNIIIKLPDCEVQNTKVSDAEFNDFISTISPYIKSQAQYVSENTSTSLVGYCKYILNSTDGNLDEQDSQRRKLLLSLLG